MTDHGQQHEGETLRAAQETAVRDVMGWGEQPDAFNEQAVAETAAEVVDAVLAAGTDGSDANGWPFEALRTTGLLWLINRVTFHPRGYALALVKRGADITGWKLLGDGTEVWRFEGDEDGHFERVRDLLAPAGPVPSLLVDVPAELSEDQAEQLKARFREAMAQPQRITVLPGPTPDALDQAEARGYAAAVAELRGVVQRTGSPAAQWAADYLEAVGPGREGRIIAYLHRAADGTETTLDPAEIWIVREAVGPGADETAVEGPGVDRPTSEARSAASHLRPVPQRTHWSVMTRPFLACPNKPPCPHPSLIHDIYEPGDPYPTCCAEGCRCGQPGDAVCVQADDGTVTVTRADPVILVSRELLDNAAAWAYDREAEVLQLDTAGRYRYGYLRPGPDQHTAVFGRLVADPNGAR